MAWCLIHLSGESGLVHSDPHFLLLIEQLGGTGLPWLRGHSAIPSPPNAAHHRRRTTALAESRTPQVCGLRCMRLFGSPGGQTDSSSPRSLHGPRRTQKHDAVAVRVLEGAAGAIPVAFEGGNGLIS